VVSKVALQECLFSISRFQLKIHRSAILQNGSFPKETESVEKRKFYSDAAMTLLKGLYRHGSVTPAWK
jgi:hypothetical protein